MANSPYLDATKILPLGIEGGYNSLVSLSQLSNVTLLSALLFIRQKWIWENPIAPISDALFEAINHQLDQTAWELMNGMQVGQLFAHIALLTDPNVILLIGQTVLQVDYPELTAVVPASWLVGADIQLPDMRDKGLFGGTIPTDLGVVTGSNTETLTTAQIPSHTHTQLPHVHTELSPLTTPTGAGPIVAGASLVVPTPVPTSPTVATNNPTGGDGSHNNIQESLQVAWYIVAR